MAVHGKTAGCFENNRDWTKLSDIKAEWGEDKIEAYADQTIAVREGQLVLDADEMILYTYNTHKKVLDPQTAYLQPTGPTTGEPFVGNWPYLWPFLDPDYLERYTKVKWSVDGYVDPPTIDY